MIRRFANSSSEALLNPCFKPSSPESPRLVRRSYSSFDSWALSFPLFPMVKLMNRKIGKGRLWERWSRVKTKESSRFTMRFSVLCGLLWLWLFCSRLSTNKNKKTVVCAWGQQTRPSVTRILELWFRLFDGAKTVVFS